MDTRALIAILASSLGWGFGGIGSRAAFGEGASTFTVIVVRVVIAAALIVAVFGRRDRLADRRAWRDGILIGVPRIGMAPVFYIASLNFISAGFEGLVITLTPVVTSVLAALFLGERLTRRQILGLVIGVTGTTLLIASGDSGIADGSGNTIIGGGLALLGVLSGSSSGVLARRFAPRHGTPNLAVPMFVSGAVVSTVAGLALGDVDLPGLTPTAWQIVVPLALGSTLLPFLGTLYASRHTTAARVALTGYIAPVIGVVGGWLLLDEVLTPSILVGGALAIAGSVLVGRRSRPIVPAGIRA